MQLGSKYTLSIKLLLDRTGQSNKFRKKSKKTFRDIQQMTLPKIFFNRTLRQRSSMGRPEKALGTFQIILPGASLGRRIRTSPGCHFWRTSSGSQIEKSPRWSNRIFRERPGDTGRGRPGEQYLPAELSLQAASFHHGFLIQQLLSVLC